MEEKGCEMHTYNDANLAVVDSSGSKKDSQIEFGVVLEVQEHARITDPSTSQ